MEPISLSKKRSKDEVENEKREKESIEMREELLQAYAEVILFFFYSYAFERRAKLTIRTTRSI